jgi:hypothetical protein
MACENLCGRKSVISHLPSVLLLLRQQRVAASNGLGAGLGERQPLWKNRVTTHLPSVLLLVQKRRVAAGNGLGNGLGNNIKSVRTC